MRKGLFCNENIFSFRAYRNRKGTKAGIPEGRKEYGRWAEVPFLSPSLSAFPCGLGFPFPSGLWPSLPFRFCFVSVLAWFAFPFLFPFPF